MANKFNASEISVWSLFNNNSMLFNIPAYQRGYSWTKEEAHTLFEDIKNFARNGLVNQSYYIGNIILQQDETEQSTRRMVYQVVDGQQRMTTMILIIAAVRNHIKQRIAGNAGDKEFLEELWNSLNRLIYFDSVKKTNRELQLKIYNKDYDDNMKHVIENTYNDALPDGVEFNSKYYDNYHYILTQGIQKSLRTDEEIHEFINSLEKIVMVEVILSNNDNALVVFENINSKGHELTAHDLIKNYTYIMAASLPYEDRDSFDERITKIFDSKIKDSIKSDKELSSFWRVVCSIISNQKQPKNQSKEIYNSFKDAAFKNLGLNGDTPSNEMSSKLEKLLNMIERNYLIYNEIMENKGRGYHLKERWQRSVAFIADKTFDSLAPILFKIYNDYKDERLTREEFEESIIAVNKYKIRRKLSYDQIKDLKNFSMAIIEFFNKDENRLPFTKKNFVDYLENVAFESPYRKNIDNLAFESSLKTTDLYNNDAASEMLIEYEYSLNKNETLMADSKRKIQVEHVLPQTIFDEKKNAYAKGWEHIDRVKHNQWHNTIGNLTLTFDNQEMSNKPYSEKKKSLVESNLRINGYFSEVYEWEIESIIKRVDTLTKEISKLWEI